MIKIRSKGNKNYFRRQVVLLFSFVTIIPSICVFLFASVFFNIGIESFFKAPVKIAMKNANQVSNIYIHDMMKALENYTLGVGNRIQSALKNGEGFDRESIENILNSETEGLGIDAIIIQRPDDNTRNIIARSLFTLSLQFEDIPSDFLYLNDGEIISWESKNCVLSIEALDSEESIYLLVSRNVDQRILDHKDKINVAVNEYTMIANQRSVLKITFLMVFMVITIILLFIVVFIGIIFANRIVKPVNKLIWAAKNVSLGDYNTLISTNKFRNEFDLLISSFNKMILKLEEQRKTIIISNRQNAWRDIARKIAHEIKNPLTPIQLSAERLRRKYEREIKTDPNIFISCVETIIRQVHFIGNLVKEFSDFARMPAPKFEYVDIIKIIKDTIFLQNNAHRNILFLFENNNIESYMCYVDPLQINQVLMNLLQNSINAINENVDKRNDNSDIMGRIRVIFERQDRGYILIVEDDGPGFSDSALEHALDPYYTTRESGNGLGLAIVYKIIIEHGGSIDIQNSEVLGGGSVKIYIPNND